MRSVSQHSLPKGSIQAMLRHQLPSHTGKGGSVRCNVLHLQVCSASAQLRCVLLASHEVEDKHQSACYRHTVLSGYSCAELVATAIARVREGDEAI